jgi:predicted nucleic acid-binding protein
MDSNVIIDFCNGKLSVNGKKFLEKIDPEISIITNIELFATKNISSTEYDLLRKFVEISVVHPLNSDLVKCTIDIRQNYKLKLPDAIIAATAIVLNLVLLSRNTSDFKNIVGLQLIDLYSL